MAIYLGTNKVDGSISIETGNTVEYTPTISSGTELGKLTIDGTDSSIYAPTIPTKVSDLINDSGFLTQHQDISGKVDKVTGKGLSTEDYTTAEKTKLAGLINGIPYGVCTSNTQSSTREVTVTPSITLTEGTIIAVKFTIEHSGTSTLLLDVNSLGAVDVIYGVSWSSAEGMRVTFPANAVLLLTYGSTTSGNPCWIITNIIKGKATIGFDGYMSKEDKRKLNGIEEYAEPNTDGTVVYAEDSTSIPIDEAVGIAVFSGDTFDDNKQVGIMPLEVGEGGWLDYNLNWTVPEIDDIDGLSEALDDKQDTLTSGTNIKTINGNSILGSGDLTINNSASSYLVTPGDQRSVATTPNTYVNKLIFQGLKTNTVINSPSSDTYSYLVGLRGWSDSSGGNSYEIAFNNTGAFIRSGATTSWGSWRKVYDSGNLVAATTSAQGLMSAADKTAVNKIGTGTLNTSNKNCIAAINELKSSLGYGGLISYSVPTYDNSGANGYIRLPGKIQICFGTMTKYNNGLTTTFAQPFSAIPFVSFNYCSTDTRSKNIQYYGYIYNLTATGFEMGSSLSSSTESIHYIAIGKYS